MPAIDPHRRRLLQQGLLATAAFSPLQNLALAQPADALPRGLQARLAAIERRSGGRLGLQILHSSSGQRWGWRSDERFPMCSSFKLLLAAQALAAQAQGQLALDERLAYGASDLVAHSPITEGLVAQGSMSVAELCAATLATSDNTAANLVLARLGGPPAFTGYMRSLGDGVTRLDRYEPQMNAAGSAPDWDSSSPAAMAHSLQRLLLGDALPGAQRQQLIAWLQASLTGGRRLRAGLPAGWRAAEKTGTSHSATNDIGVVWPSIGAPLVVVAFIRDSSAAMAVREACLADLGRLLTQPPWLSA